MGIEIRIAAPEDAFAACDVLRRSITECCVQDHRNQAETLQAWLGNKTPENVCNWFTSPSNFSLVAERDGVVVGVALLTQAGKLSLCYVLPEVLHQGIGKAMLHGIEDVGGWTEFGLRRLLGQRGRDRRALGRDGFGLLGQRRGVLARRGAGAATTDQGGGQCAQGA